MDPASPDASVWPSYPQADQWKMGRQREVGPCSYSSSELLNWLTPSVKIKPGNVSDEKVKYCLQITKASFKMYVKFWLLKFKKDEPKLERVQRKKW